MTTCPETLTNMYDRLNTEIFHFSNDLAHTQDEINRIEDLLSSLKSKRDQIQNLYQKKTDELKSLTEKINSSSLTQSKSDEEKIEKPIESDSNENKESAPRSETPLTINTMQSWASMCSDSEDDASIATNEDDFESIVDKHEETSACVESKGRENNTIVNAVLFKKTDLGGLFHLTTLDGKPIKHNDNKSGHQDVFKFKNGKFLENNYPDAAKGMKIAVRLDTNFPNNNLIWAILNEYKATVASFEQKIAGNICVSWVPVLELTTMLGEKLEGTYTFGLHHEAPWYPNRKRPSLNDTFLVSLSKNSNDEANRVFYKGSCV